VTTTLEYTIDIDRPIDEVFDVVADPRNDHRWCPRVGDCKQTAGNAPTVGARYELHHRPTLQRPHTRKIEIIELERPTKVVSIQEDNVARFTISYFLEPVASGTRLRQRDDIDWRIGPLSRQIGRRVINRHIGEQLRSLKGLLEGGAWVETSFALPYTREPETTRKEL
jgi:carbon monoxide dehydrogenase subunit G